MRRGRLTPGRLTPGRLGRRHIAAAALAVAALVAPVIAGPAVPARAATRYLDPTFSVTIRRNVVYGHAIALDGTPVELRLDLYVPKDDTAIDRPVYVFAHGGAFYSGDKNSGDAPTWANELARRGWVAASINYRMGTSPVVYPVDETLERRQIDVARIDMQTAVRWFRENAVSLGIDPGRIAVGGSSAGAITALGVATGADGPLEGDHLGHSSAVCTAISIYGATDPATIGPNDAGAFFHHGTADTIVPYALGVASYDAMVAAGLSTALHSYPGEQHGLTPASQLVARAESIQWLYDHVVAAPGPCSPAVALDSGLPGGTQTPVTGPAGRSAVVSVVAVDTTGAGYLQLLPCGASPGGWANLTTDAAGQIRAGLGVVPFGADGRTCVYNQTRTHVVVDLQGTFEPGALDDVTDVRLLDTRTGTKPADGSRVTITGRPDSTAIVSIAATENVAAGYLQVLPCDSPPGGWANLNTDHADQIRSGLAFVRFGADGRACVYVQRSAHVVVDLQAYLAPAAFDDVADVRLLDTRAGAMPTSGSQTVLTGRPDATGVVSLVATESTGPGYLQVLPCGAAPGGSANLNLDAAGQTIQGLAFVRFGSDGRACVYAQTATHVVADLQGYVAASAFIDIVDQRLYDSRTR